MHGPCPYLFLMTDIDFSKSEQAINGRYRRAEELIDYLKPRDIITGCFYPLGMSAKDFICICLNDFPDFNPECPWHKRENS
jgi:hypothetical protein